MEGMIKVNPSYHCLTPLCVWHAVDTRRQGLLHRVPEIYAGAPGHFQHRSQQDRPQQHLLLVTTHPLRRAQHALHLLRGEESFPVLPVLGVLEEALGGMGMGRRIDSSKPVDT